MNITKLITLFTFAAVTLPLSTSSDTPSGPKEVSNKAGALVAIYNLYPNHTDCWPKTFTGTITKVSGNYPERYLDIKSESIMIDVKKLSMWANSYVNSFKGKRAQIDAYGCGTGSFYYVNNIKLLTGAASTSRRSTFAKTKQQRVIERDAATLWQQIRLGKNYNMIDGVKGYGKLKGVDSGDMTDTAFVAVNRRWHRLSNTGKQKIADGVFRKWQVISKKSGRYASLKFQQSPKQDLLAQCSDDDGCEIVE